MQLWPELLKPVRAHWVAAIGEVRVLADDRRGVATELEHQSFPGAGACDCVAGRGAPGEADGCDDRATGEDGPELGAAVQDLDGASGRPASLITSTRAVELAGACGGGLTIVVLPAAKEAASLCASRFTGALNGVMVTTTPIGARTVMAVVPTPRAQPADGSTSPPILRASAAETGQRLGARGRPPRVRPSAVCPAREPAAERYRRAAPRRAQPRARARRRALRATRRDVEGSRAGEVKGTLCVFRARLGCRADDASVVPDRCAQGSPRRPIPGDAGCDTETGASAPAPLLFTTFYPSSGPYGPLGGL